VSVIVVSSIDTAVSPACPTSFRLDFRYIGSLQNETGMHYSI